MNINLDLYKTFYYIAKNKSITRAAFELSISQPAISKSIKALEEQLDVKLFIRKRDGVVLTEIGEIVYVKIKDALELIDSAEKDIYSFKNLEKGNITIGASNTIIHEYLMSYLEEFTNKYPDINVKILTDNVTNFTNKLKMGIIDVLFTNMPNTNLSDFSNIKVMDLHEGFFANEKYNYLKDKTITKKEFEQLPLLLLTKDTITRNKFDDYCINNNLNLNIKMEFESNSLIKDFTLAGFGIGMLNSEHVYNEIKEGKLFKLNIDLKLKEKYLGMIINSDKMNNPTIKKFEEFIKKSRII